MNNHFGVGGCRENMAPLDKFFSQLRIIKNFAVENNPQGSVFIGKGLPARGKVDDGQPGMAKSYPIAVIKAIPIRSPVFEGDNHPFEYRSVGIAFSVYIEVSGYATHYLDPRGFFAR
jgi:hypothetical protein